MYIFICTLCVIIVSHIYHIYCPNLGTSLPAGHDAKTGPLEKSAFITEPDENFHANMFLQILEILENIKIYTKIERSR